MPLMYRIWPSSCVRIVYTTESEGQWGQGGRRVEGKAEEEKMDTGPANQPGTQWRLFMVDGKME